jgi:hypothetical protein
LNAHACIMPALRFWCKLWRFTCRPATERLCRVPRMCDLFPRDTHTHAQCQTRLRCFTRRQARRAPTTETKRKLTSSPATT